MTDPMLRILFLSLSGLLCPSKVSTFQAGSDLSHREPVEALGSTHLKVHTISDWGILRVVVGDEMATLHVMMTVLHVRFLQSVNVFTFRCLDVPIRGPLKPLYDAKTPRPKDMDR